MHTKAFLSVSPQYGHTKESSKSICILDSKCLAMVISLVCDYVKHMNKHIPEYFSSSHCWHSVAPLLE